MFHNLALVAGIRAEIQDLEHEAEVATAEGHHDAAVVYAFGAMRLRVMLTKHGHAEPQKKAIDSFVVNRQELISCPSPLNG
ncbi:hypothetical protein [Enterovibrio norvegicus]|uniref:hypothetical protein n=1 Tax=Enterovibrio norvegicus TaxID=188144 RepID=UPI00354C6D75